MNFPSKPAGIKDEDIECIFADVFLCSIIYEHSLNPVVIALVTDVLFGEVREIACRRCLEFTVFRLFDDADIDIAAGCTIRSKCSDKFNSLVCSEGTVRANCTLCKPSALQMRALSLSSSSSDFSCASADENNNPNAHTVSRNFLILTLHPNCGLVFFIAPS
jgi:hypothetical protein